MAYENQSWWKKRTRMERRFVILLVIAILIIIGLIIAVALVAKKKNSEQKSGSESVCVTQGCVESAAQVLEHLDDSVDPCDDFYRFACGKFIKETEIPPDKAEVTQFDLLHDSVQKQLKEMFEEPSQPNEIKPFTLVKTMYNICMNTTAIEADGTTSIKEYFKNAGGWPIIEGGRWNERDFDWRKITKTFRDLGLNSDSFIAAGVQADMYNSSRRMLMFDQAAIKVLRERFLQGFGDPLVNAYYQYLVDLAIYLGGDRRTVETEVRGVVMFLIEITKISLSDEQRRNVVALYHPMTVADLQRKNPTVNWLEYINNLIGREDKHITSNEIINVAYPQYISDFLNLISRTSKRDQANYAFFQAALNLVGYLPDDIRNRQEKYTELLTGTSVRPPRWVECVSHTSGELSSAVGAMYVRRYFKEESRQSASELTVNIKNVFVQIVKDLEWMDQVTRKTAIEKALAMTPHIGYPNEFLDDKTLEKYYEKLNFSPGSFVKAMNAMDTFKLDIVLSEITAPVNKSDWRATIAAYSINAEYDPQTNNIRLPAAILQGIFFNKDRPQYMNYGSIAYIIGHEVTHGFDDTGKLFDIDGNLKNWWVNETAKAYSERAQCIIDQYSDITVPELGIKLNGAFTQGENIADSGGIKEAYLAYNKYVERKGAEPALPGLNYTSHQMFWISAANCWCAKIRPQKLENAIQTDTHSPMKYRVLVPFGNTEYFAKDFNCKAESKMNPKHKCRVW